MRNISAVSLAKIQNRFGVEPVTIVKVFWASQAVAYCDRKFLEKGLVGKLLEVSGIEDTIDINSNASSTSLTVTLDDSDGSLKDIYNNIDIHKTYVQVLQWFTGIPLSEAFIIFEGEISSPIVWTEGDRKLKFDILTTIEEIEVGFSAEEAQFAYMPSSLVGKAWPVIFGSVSGVPTLHLNETPSAILADGFAVINHTAWQKELANISKAMKDAQTNNENAYKMGVIYALIASNFKGTALSVSWVDDPEQADQYDTAAASYFAQAGNYAKERVKLALKLGQKMTQYEFQKTFERRVIPVVSSNIPAGAAFTFINGDNRFGGQIIANYLIISSVSLYINPDYHVGVDEVSDKDPEEPVLDQVFELEQNQPKFRWIPGGTKLDLENFPLIHIVSIGHVNVLNVWGHTQSGRTLVPRNYYVIEHRNFPSNDPRFPGLNATFVTFPRPLTSYAGYWQSDEVEIDAQGTIGPNVVDIMLWVIQTFSRFGWDEPSFNLVRNQVAAYPANFALTSRKNVVQFLQEVAFQSRCAIWLNDRKFYIRYLPAPLNPIEEIHDRDVEVGSVQLTTTQTERLVTKFVAQWKLRLSQDEPYEIIYRYNIGKYGVQEETYDFYIYNNQELVQKSAEFWMIRKANTWKLVSFKTFLHKLKIETFDPILIQFNESICTYGPIVGIVQKATYNSDEDTISIQVWLPVRLGEMGEYTFAFPGTKQVYYPVIGDPNVNTGNPYSNATGIPIGNIFIPDSQPITYSHYDPFTHGRGEPIGDHVDHQPPNYTTALSPTTINTALPQTYTTFNQQSRYQIQDPQPFEFLTPTASGFYGEVISKINDLKYRCNVWFQGLTNSPKPMDVAIGYIKDDTTLQKGYPLVIQRTIYYTGKTPNRKINVELWAQPPIWGKAPKMDDSGGSGPGGDDPTPSPDPGGSSNPGDGTSKPQGNGSTNPNTPGKSSDNVGDAGGGKPQGNGNVDPGNSKGTSGPPGEDDGDEWPGYDQGDYDYEGW